MAIDKASEQLWREEMELYQTKPCTKLYRVKKTVSLHHKQEDHDFLVGRYGRCRYCELGSKVMSREEINKGME